MACCLLSAIGPAACSGGGSSGEEEDLIYVSSSCDSSAGAVGQNQYCSLDDAIAAAATKGNPVLVLDDGEYTVGTAIDRTLTIRSLSFSGSASALSLKGAAVSSDTTCVSSGTVVTLSLNPRATITASGDKTPLTVRMSNSGHTLKLQGVRIRAPTGRAAVHVTRGRVAISQSVVAGPLIVAGGEARAVVSNSSLSPTLMAQVARIYASRDELVHNVYTSLNDCDEDADYRAALIVNDGASFVATGMEISDHSGIGLCVDDATAMFCDSRIFDIDVTSYGTMGRGAYVTGSGSLTFKRSEISDCHEVGILADGRGTTLTLSDDSQVREIQLSVALGEALGVALQNDAELSMSDASIQENVGVGLYLASGATATVASSEISDNRAAGIAAFRATLAMTTSTIHDTTAGTSNGMGVGVFIDNTDGASTVAIDQSTIQGNYVGGIYMAGDGSLAVTNSSILDSIEETISASRGLMGHGIFADGVCSDISLGGNYFDGNEGAHVFLNDSNATLSTSTYIPGGSWDFVQQDCDNSCIAPFDLAALYAVGLSASNGIALCDTPLLVVDEKEFTLYLSEGTVAE